MIRSRPPGTIQAEIVAWGLNPPPGQPFALKEDQLASSQTISQTMVNIFAPVVMPRQASMFVLFNERKTRGQATEVNNLVQTTIN